MNPSMLQERIPRWFGCGTLVLLLGACSGERPAPRTASDTTNDRTTVSAVTPATQTTRADRANDAQKANLATGVNVSDELRQQCQLPEAPADAPKFDYDQAALTPVGRETLERVARCLSEGPMQGRPVTIIGHADPRGTEQYNLELSMSRAQAARDFLTANGVPADQIQVVARGEGEAQGTSEAGWALDRRVDIEVARPAPVSTLSDTNRTDGNRDASATERDSERDRARNPFVEARRIQASDPHREPESAESSKARVYADQPEGGHVVATQP